MNILLRLSHQGIILPHGRVMGAQGVLRLWRTTSALLAVVAVITLLTACQQRPVLYQYTKVSQEGWHSFDTLYYEVPSLPAAGTYTFTLGARFTNSYPYGDLWLVLEQRYGGDSISLTPEVRHRDTLHLQADFMANKWQSRGTTFHDVEAEVTTTHLTPQQMPLKLLVYHIMRRQRLKGISDIGVRMD